MADRSTAGTEFNGWIYELLELEGLKPIPSYRLPGQEIDAAFTLGEHNYVCEAKWTSRVVGQNHLVRFHDKIDEKPASVRGVMISASGYARDAEIKLWKNRRPDFIMLDAGHLLPVVRGSHTFGSLVSRQYDRFERTGVAYAPSGHTLRELLDDVAGQQTLWPVEEWRLDIGRLLDSDASVR